MRKIIDTDYDGMGNQGRIPVPVKPKKQSNKKSSAFINFFKSRMSKVFKSL